MHCGLFQFPRPSMGAWVLYGLGSENENLPGFITISPPQAHGGPTNYGASFLSAVCQGTRIGRGGPARGSRSATGGTRAAPSAPSACNSTTSRN
jgi:hypothetical protein